MYFVRIVIAFARIIVAAPAQNRMQKRRSLPGKLSLHHLSSFSCSQNSETNYFIFSRQIIWQKMKSVYKRSQNDQRQELRQNQWFLAFRVSGKSSTEKAKYRHDRNYGGYLFAQSCCQARRNAAYDRNPGLLDTFSVPACSAEEIVL
jgi:hypothetical protein